MSYLLRALLLFATRHQLGESIPFTQKKKAHCRGRQISLGGMLGTVCPLLRPQHEFDWFQV
jgi:hypothetical protein